MKYARIERELRYLLTELPPGLTPDGPYTHIIDRYIPGTRLRLRRMEDPQDNVTALKLTQKYDPPTGVGPETIITNLYLNEAEFQIFACIEGSTLRKRRYPYPHEGITYSIDVFEGPLNGLILCELEFDERTVAHIEMPPFATREVTDDPTFTGGHLVTLKELP